MGPLEGVKMLEFAGIGPGPFAAMMLSDMGAEILRIDRDQVLIQGPLGEGEKICISPLQVVVEGMHVMPVLDESGRDSATPRATGRS